MGERDSRYVLRSISSDALGLLWAVGCGLFGCLIPSPLSPLCPLNIHYCNQRHALSTSTPSQSSLLQQKSCRLAGPAISIWMVRTTSRVLLESASYPTSY